MSLPLYIVFAHAANKSQQSRKDLLKSAGEAWRKIKANKTSFNNYNLAASKKNANDKKLSQHQMKPWQNKVVKEMQVLVRNTKSSNGSFAAMCCIVIFSKN